MFILNRIHQSKYILPHIANFVKTFRKLLFKAEIKKVTAFFCKLRITFMDFAFNSGGAVQPARRALRARGAAAGLYRFSMG